MQRNYQEKVEHFILDVNNPPQIPAEDAEIGGVYLSRTGLKVIVRGRKGKGVVVHSLATGHEVQIPPSYLLTQDPREEKDSRKPSCKAA